MEEQIGGPSGTSLTEFTSFLRFLLAVSSLQVTRVPQSHLCLFSAIDAVLKVKLALLFLHLYQSWMFILVGVLVLMQTNWSLVCGVSRSAGLSSSGLCLSGYQVLASPGDVPPRRLLCLLPNTAGAPGAAL